MHIVTTYEVGQYVFPISYDAQTGEWGLSNNGPIMIHEVTVTVTLGKQEQYEAYIVDKGDDSFGRIYHINNVYASFDQATRECYLRNKEEVSDNES